MTVDAVIVGSGPGGATAADVLTQAGWSVVILEKGRNHLIDIEHPERLSGDYSNDEIKFIYRYFLGPDPLIEPRTFRTGPQDGDRTHIGEVNSIPSTVGGGGTHADGKVPRFREDDFRLLSTFGPQPDAAVADWPLSYEQLEPFYAEVERLMGVSGTEKANPFAAWRSGPFPMPSGAPMFGAIRSSAAAEKLGFHPYPAPTAANSVPYDGRPACNNCGFCAFFGCPIHAKGDPVAMLQRALRSGHAELKSECFVSKVRTDGARATGVEFIDAEGVTGSIDAQWILLAGGAIETPRLMLLSGFNNPLIGRYLMVHFQSIAAGIMPFRVHSERGRAVTHVHDDYIIGDAGSAQAAKDARLPWIRGGMVEHGGPSLPIMEAKLYPWGETHKKLMRRSPMRDHLWAFTMQGEDLPYMENAIDLDPTVRDIRGFPVARMTYRGRAHELVASEHFRRHLIDILNEMGATWTTSTTSPGVRVKGRGAWPVPESRHVMGTTRMGTEPGSSVVDPIGRVHGLDNVVVVDSSVFVTSAGYGPTLTLAALAARAAHAIAGTSPPNTADADSARTSAPSN